MSSPRRNALFVKICGMTTPAAVSAAISCEVDAIGFVFAQSVRRVTPQRAAELAAPARHKVACAAVMRHPTRAEVDEVLRDFRPDFLQTDIEDLDALDLPKELPVLPVLRPGPKPACAIPRRVLFEGPVSGSGLTTDWDAAAELAQRLELILAGGLNPRNVAAAVRHVRPFGVDVSSGVEDQPGIKNTELIEQFVAAARMAALEQRP
ncbi:MAG TPA: phosphoribosylanthranilate isomerase [Steroidobacteraceae bacterium]|nr:phosphoribosylanthranilate isomerase [Steroidobacteraceae bacterium]